VAPETLAVHEKVLPPGLQETEVVVEAWLTVRLAVPELAALFESPGYDAWMVT